MAARRVLSMAEGVRVPYLHAWRMRKLIKQNELAAAAGVTRFTVRRAEIGEPVSIDSVRKLANALDLTPDQLRYEPPEEPHHHQHPEARG